MTKIIEQMQNSIEIIKVQLHEISKEEALIKKFNDVIKALEHNNNFGTKDEIVVILKKYTDFNFDELDITKKKAEWDEKYRDKLTLEYMIKILKEQFDVDLNP